MLSQTIFQCALRSNLQKLLVCKTFCIFLYIPTLSCIARVNKNYNFSLINFSFCPVSLTSFYSFTEKHIRRVYYLIVPIHVRLFLPFLSSFLRSKIDYVQSLTCQSFTGHWHHRTNRIGTLENWENSISIIENATLRLTRTASRAAAS